jgi:ketosteroid isomerase-like protein
MRRFLCLSTLLFVAAFVFAQTGTSMGQSGSASSDEQQLIKIEQQWADAMKSGDASALQRIEADDYVFTNPEGQVTTKENDVNDLKSGQVKYESVELSDLHAHVDGDTGVVTGHIAIKGTDRGKDISGNYTFTDSFAKRNGVWQAVSTQSNKLPE